MVADLEFRASRSHYLRRTPLFIAIAAVGWCIFLTNGLPDEYGEAILLLIATVGATMLILFFVALWMWPTPETVVTQEYLVVRVYRRHRRRIPWSDIYAVSNVIELKGPLGIRVPIFGLKLIDGEYLEIPAPSDPETAERLRSVVAERAGAR